MGMHYFQAPIDRHFFIGFAFASVVCKANIKVFLKNIFQIRIN